MLFQALGYCLVTRELDATFVAGHWDEYTPQVRRDFRVSQAYSFFIVLACLCIACSVGIAGATLAGTFYCEHSMWSLFLFVRAYDGCVNVTHFTANSSMASGFDV